MPGLQERDIMSENVGLFHVLTMSVFRTAIF